MLTSIIREKLLVPVDVRNSKWLILFENPNFYKECMSLFMLLLHVPINFAACDCCYFLC